VLSAIFKRMPPGRVVGSRATIRLGMSAADNDAVSELQCWALRDVV
jgi:hypothetical protein